MLDGNTVRINWGKFGNYELNFVDESGTNLYGSATGNPSNWRKATRTRAITILACPDKADCCTPGCSEDYMSCITK